MRRPLCIIRVLLGVGYRVLGVEYRVLGVGYRMNLPQTQFCITLIVKALSA